MPYLNTWRLANDPQLWERLVPAIAEVAIAVYNEAGTVPNTAVRKNLVAYAGPSSENFRQFAREIGLLVCVLNTGLTVSSTDAQLKTAVETLWTPYAQVLAKKGVIAAT